MTHVGVALRLLVGSRRQHKNLRPLAWRATKSRMSGLRDSRTAEIIRAWKSYGQESERRRALWGIDWPGHPAGADRPKVGAPERDPAGLEDAPERWTLSLVANDPGANYDYDDLALLRRDDGEWALVRTSGCSCPSPTETWGYVARGTLDDVARHIEEDRVSWGGEARGPYPEMQAHVEKLRQTCATTPSVSPVP